MAFVRHSFRKLRKRVETEFGGYPPIRSICLRTYCKGKNPVLVLHAAAVHSAAINPVVMANLAPIKAWSIAWWEEWACADTMSRTYVKCSDRVHKAGANPWSAVHGPAAALAATCKRLKWTRSRFGKLTFSMYVLTWSLFANHTRLVSKIT